MATFRKFLPANDELWYGLAAIAFPIHVWALIVAFQEIPALILRLNTWDMIGVIAYSQMYVFIETLLFFLAFVIISAILPARLFRQKFVAISTIVIFLTGIWFVFLHYNNDLIDGRQLLPLAIWGVSLLTLIAALYVAVQRKETVQNAIESFIKRLASLSALYLVIDIVSIIIVFMR